ncbi:hypothetical protein GpartN1_g5222.t1 [Galdieria partita]|uniref:Gluconokinase n=1 Tax=Galdieria partita TaxID=83374 RepID=A0A9C7PZH3_9RHOD|nr:hypothetical protein GpartN1_g979.t1 [Galdieria partita]GJQ13431.1 hypothetical protein GpartN1_g5222.t1 [Galdieria partita]
MRVVVVFIGGVSGVGKTTVAVECSHKFGNSCFLDADDFHSVQNKEKMKQGIPLNDSDRKPWLEQLVKVVGERVVEYKRQEATNDYVIFCACSVLKLSYRQYLRNSLCRSVDGCIFILLTAKTQVLLQRMQTRPGHFMPSTLLSSQLEALEQLTDEEKRLGDKSLDTSDQSVPQVVSCIVKQLKSQL